MSGLATMTAMPEFWIVAGPNGAGKTTLVQAVPISNLLPHVTFLNPDDVALALLRGAGFAGFDDPPPERLNEAFRAAANNVFEELLQRLAVDESVGVETVLASGKYREVVEEVLHRGGFVGLIYVWLDRAETACARVDCRIARGGHPVPRDKIISRWRRSIDNLPWFLSHASRFWVFDNTNSDPTVPPPLLACGTGNHTEFCATQCPRDLLRALPPRITDW